MNLSTVLLGNYIAATKKRYNNLPFYIDVMDVFFPVLLFLYS